MYNIICFYSKIPTGRKNNSDATFSLEAVDAVKTKRGIGLRRNYF